MKLLFVCVTFLSGLTSPAFAKPAFGGPGVAFPWATSEKQGYGTAFSRTSKVWFTIARGIVTEIFYPRVDIPQSRDSQFLISDGRSFLHQEQFDTETRAERVPGAPLFHITNRDWANRYVIEKEIWADSEKEILIQRVRIRRNIDGLRFYFLHKPAAANSIFGDSAFRAGLTAGEDSPDFGAWQAVSSSLAFAKKSVGFVGESDGYTDLRDFHMDYEFDEAATGNVALTAELAIPPVAGTTEFAVFLAFGRDRATALGLSRSALALNLDESRTRFLTDWRGYLGGLDFPRVDEARRRLLETSALVLKSAEDKTFPGAIIASPSHPWGENHPEFGMKSDPGYHVVWPRDLYHAANALMALGDRETVAAVLRRLGEVQYGESDGMWSFGPRSHKKRGSFPQNFWANGKTVYGGYQADETAMPVILAYRAWKRGIVSLGEVWPLVREAAVFLSEVGPWTQNERWEEVHGISPNSAAYVISALVVASEMAFALGEVDLHAKFLALADQWATKTGDNIDTWTFTTHGKIRDAGGDGRYYVRIDGAGCRPEEGGTPIWDALWNPNDDKPMSIGSIPGTDRFKLESEVIDASFLALVRLGVRSANYPLVRETLPEIDAILRRETERGTGFYRYRFDGYGEENRGRLWPLLTGERWHYELQFAKETGGSFDGEARVRAFENFASPEGIFSEQVWDEGDKAGVATGSAAPLLWTHAEYVQLVRSVADGKVFEEISAVRDRYGN